MMTFNCLKKWLNHAILSFGLSFVTMAHAEPAEVLHAFSEATEGGNPHANLTVGADGFLYGSTFWGGSDGNRGTLFRISPNGEFETIVALNDAEGWVEGDLILANDLNFYGTSASGGSNGDGSVFRLTSEGAVEEICSFHYPETGWLPSSGVMQAADGNFYGATEYGGEKQPPGGYGDSYGTIFKVTPDGSLTTILAFSSTNGANPWAAPIQGEDGNLYGTTVRGGAGRAGTVYRLNPGGALTTLVSFDGTNGTGPEASLIQCGNGYLYGTTVAGGSGNGTLFRLSTNGDFSILVNFNGTNGARPLQIIEARDGNIYGITGSGGTSNDGTVFRMTRDGILTTIYSFDYESSGSGPQGIVQGPDGNLYGTTGDGPGYLGSGTIFRILITPPTVSAERTEAGLALSWPTNRAGFTLQYSAEVNSTNWIDCTNSPAVVGSRFFVTNNLAGGKRFYRLQKAE